MFFLGKFFQNSEVSSQIVRTLNNFSVIPKFKNLKPRRAEPSYLSKYCTKPSSSCEYGRHGFHAETESMINEQILMELKAAFAYLSMSCYFGRTDVALPGCQGYFMNMHQEEHEHAAVFINYQLMRGGSVNLFPIPVPEKQTFDITSAFETALLLEKTVKEKLVDLFNVAEKHKDLNLMDLVSTEFMEEQNRSICSIARLLTKAKMVDTKVGEHIFDDLLFNSFVKTVDKNLMYKNNMESDYKTDVYK